MQILVPLQFPDSDQVSSIRVISCPIVALITCCVLTLPSAILGGNDRDGDSAVSGDLRANRRIDRRIDLGETDKHICVVGFGISSRVFEDALNPVNSVREIGAALDACERRGDQHQQETDKADDDQ